MNGVEEHKQEFLSLKLDCRKYMLLLIRKKEIRKTEKKSVLRETHCDTLVELVARQRIGMALTKAPFLYKLVFTVIIATISSKPRAH